MSDNRREPRIKVEVPVILRSNGGKLVGSIEDVSQRGLGVMLASQIAPGTEVRVEIKHETASIHVTGCVVRVTPRERGKWRWHAALELDAPASELVRLLAT